MQSDTVTLNGSRYHAKGLRSSTCIRVPRSRWNWVYSMLWYVMICHVCSTQDEAAPPGGRQYQTMLTDTDRPPALPALQTIQSEAASTVHVLPWLGTSPRHQPWRTLRMPNFKGHWRYLVVHDLSTSKLCASWILLLMSQSSLHCGWWPGHRAVIRSKTRLSVFHDSEFHLVEVFATIGINFPFLWCTPFISSSNILTIATTA